MADEELYTPAGVCTDGTRFATAVPWPEVDTTTIPGAVGIGGTVVLLESGIVPKINPEFMFIEADPLDAAEPGLLNTAAALEEVGTEELVTFPSIGIVTAIGTLLTIGVADPSGAALLEPALDVAFPAEAIEFAVPAGISGPAL